MYACAVQLLNQLDESGSGAPPASTEQINALPTVSIIQSQVGELHKIMHKSRERHCCVDGSVCLRSVKGKGSPYSVAERRVPELIPVLGSQPAGDVSHKPGSRLPLLSSRPAVNPATLNFAAW